MIVTCTAPDSSNCGLQICFLYSGFFGFRTSLAQKLLEFRELRWRDDLEDHSIALANDHELVAFVEPEIIADLFGNDDLSFR